MSTPTTTIDPKPDSDKSIFDTIALSMSGGGFRAAAYALGTLNMLNRLGLLANVQILSTISGGTITGAFYALRRKQGHSFEKIYAELYDLLAADTILPNALKHWQKAIESTDKNYKLIRAFADVYDELLYDHKHFNTFWESTTPVDPQLPPPLQTVVFGATEMYSGTAFRFQYADLPNQFVLRNGQTIDSYMIGNGNIHIQPERARQLRLGDIVAASSCLPVGFEPLVLPDDFPTIDSRDLAFFSSTTSSTDLSSANSSGIGSRLQQVDRLALVDGGIYDNQGIEGLRLADRRNRNYLDLIKEGIMPTPHKRLPTPVTLFLLSDVAGADTDIYKAPEPGPSRRDDSSFKRIDQQLSNLKWGLLGAVLLFLLIQVGSRHGGNFMFGLLAGLSLAGLAILLAGRVVWAKAINAFKSLSPDMYRLAMPPLRQLTIKQSMYLLKGRLSSLVALLWSVFLRRSRSLNYSLLYSDNDAPKTKTSFVVMPSIIGGILDDYENPQYRSQLQPFIETILTASKMPTTLWWLNDKRRMDPIIASAEITLLWRIICHFDRHKEELTGKDKAVYDNAKELLNEYRKP